MELFKKEYDGDSIVDVSRDVFEASGLEIMRYFSYDPNGNGFELHKTGEEAKKVADDALGYERGEASEGWDDNVDQICWGELKQRVVMTESRPRTDEDVYVSSDIDMIVNYRLSDVASGGA